MPVTRPRDETLGMSSSESPIQYVLFDMDGVLCDLDDARRIAFLAELTRKDPDYLSYQIWGSGFENDSDEGKFSAEEYLNEFGNRMGKAIDASTWISYRRSGMTPNVSVLRIAEALSETVQLAILTNNGFMLKQSIDSLFPELLPIFGKNFFVSAEFGCRKPDPKVYSDLCCQLGWNPDKVLFIDDREENTIGAQSAGLRSLTFAGAEHFADTLNVFRLRV